MSDLPTHIIRFADLPGRKRSQFTIQPDAAGRRALAQTLGLQSIRKIRFDGMLIPMGKRDWRIEAKLGATIVQSCVVTLEPITTRIDEEVMRSYLTEIDTPDETEVEMVEDDTTDPLPDTLDLIEVMTEALVLAMPAYPRIDGADPATLGVTEPGKQLMTDEDARPFAGLAALRANLQTGDTNGDTPDESDDD